MLLVWFSYSTSASASAEVEYENHTSPTVWVRYRLQSDPRTIDPALADARIHGNKPVFNDHLDDDALDASRVLAVAFHPDEGYVALEAADEIYIVAEKLAKDVAAKCGFRTRRPSRVFRVG